MMEQGWHVVALGDLNASEPYDKTTAQNAMGVLTGLDSPGKEDDLIDLHAKLPANGRGTHGTKRELDRIATSLSLANGPKWKLDSVRVVAPARGAPRADSREWDNPNRRFEPGAAVSDHFPVEAVFKRK
jgi:endonuclease/exonuclease/phosphatase family metal-dependent hydrolase